LKNIDVHLESYQEDRGKSLLLFEDVQLILTELGFIHSGGRQAMRKDTSIDIHKERDLLDDLWMHLKGEYHGTVNNLRTFLYGILGLKFPWMLIKSDKEHPENSSNYIYTERSTSSKRYYGTQRVDNHKGKQPTTQRSSYGGENNNTGFNTLNLFNNSPMGNSLTVALQNFQNEKKGRKLAHQAETISSKLGECVGTMTPEGEFLFTKKVEIRKVNMHYKLFTENRAKFVRIQKLDISVKKTEEKVLKPKVDHKKYLRKPPQPYEPKPASILKSPARMIEENQGQSFEGKEEYKQIKMPKRCVEIDM